MIASKRFIGYASNIIVVEEKDKIIIKKDIPDLSKFIKE